MNSAGIPNFVLLLRFLPIANGCSLAVVVLTISWRSCGRLMESLLREFLGHNFQVISVAFAPDGKSILTGARDNTAKWWNVNGDCYKSLKDLWEV